MQIGMIGLGRMGGNMVRRLMRAGHQCVVYNRSAEAVNALQSEGADGAVSLEDFVARLTRPRAVWLMVPAPVISAALFERFTSRGDADYANRVLSAMRKQFGGHDEKKEGRRDAQ